MPLAFVGLGSNLGDRLATLRAAAHAIADHPSVRVLLPRDAAALYETSPVGGPPGQPGFLNSALRLETSLSAFALLEVAQSIETSLGRTRGRRWEARVIDIDLLLFGERVVDSPMLTLPHPRLHERRFVLEPLSELAGDLIHPVLGISITTLADTMRHAGVPDAVRRVRGPDWVHETQPKSHRA